MQKNLHDPDNHDGAITHLEPDILECEVKWDLGGSTLSSTKLDRRQWNFSSATSNPKIWCHEIAPFNMPANLENSAAATGMEKVSFHSNPKERQCQGRFIALISHASKVMLKILQARLQQYVNHEFPDVQAGFRKGREIRDQIPNIRLIIEKAREFQENTYFCFIDYTKALECWITTKCG